MVKKREIINAIQPLIQQTLHRTLRYYETTVATFLLWGLMGKKVSTAWRKAMAKRAWKKHRAKLLKNLEKAREALKAKRAAQKKT